MVLRCAAVALLVAARAQAEPDRFWLGDGHHGPLTVAAGNTVTVPAAPLLQDVPAGTKQLSTALQVSPGDLILLVTSKGLSFTPGPGDAGAIPLAAEELGRYELARVGSITRSEEHTS